MVACNMMSRVTLFWMQVAEMYRSQEQIVNQMKKKMEVDDDDME